MGLLLNGIYSYRVASHATLLGSQPINRKNFATNALTWQTTIRSFTSYPSGLSQSAFYLPVKYGAIRVTIEGSSSVSAGIIGAGVLNTSITGGSTITQGKLNAGINLLVTVTGGGELIVTDIDAPAKMTCTIRIGANPSAFDIAQAVLNAVASEYNIAGTIGNKINASGASGDPWETDLDTYTTDGTAGKILKDAKAKAAAAAALSA